MGSADGEGSERVAEELLDGEHWEGGGERRRLWRVVSSGNRRAGRGDLKEGRTWIRLMMFGNGRKFGDVRSMMVVMNGDGVVAG